MKSQEEAASPTPVGRGSDDEEACLRHSTPPTGTLMQAACKPTPHMYLSAGELRSVRTPTLPLHCGAHVMLL